MAKCGWDCLIWPSLADTVRSHEQSTYDADSSARDLCHEISNNYGSHNPNDELNSDTQEGVVHLLCAKGHISTEVTDQAPLTV